MTPLGKRVPGTRHPRAPGAAVIWLGAGTGLRSRVRGDGRAQELGDAAALWSGSDMDDKKVKVLLFSQKGEVRGGESAWNGRMVGADISPYLGALVDDFVVLGVETGQKPQALTPSAPPGWAAPPGETGKAALVSALVPLCAIWGGETFCIGTLGTSGAFLCIRWTSSRVCLGTGAAVCCRQQGRAHLLGTC